MLLNFPMHWFKLMIENVHSSLSHCSGWYAMGCVIEQSCIPPNCRFVFDKRNGFKLTVRAGWDIRQGEHIATCFSAIATSAVGRKEIFQVMRRSDRITNSFFIYEVFRLGWEVPENSFSDNVEWISSEGVSRRASVVLFIKMSKETFNDKLADFLYSRISTLKHSLIQLHGNHSDYSIESISTDALMRNWNSSTIYCKLRSD